jgi:uncharacterized membrane protein
MTLYLTLKWLHVLSAAVLFGTGLGIAFFMWLAYRSRDVAAVAATARIVVIADFLFTLPAVVVQPLSGLGLVRESGYALSEHWLLLSMALYLLAGVCWLPVVFLQMRARNLARAARADGAPLPPAFHRIMRLWFRLGWPAFLSVLAIYLLMVFKPEF